MKLGSHNEAFVLLAGDIVLLYLSLYLTLIIRYGPAGAGSAWPAHLIPFSLLFVAWIIIFFISGLYEKHTLFFRKKLPAILLNAQIASIVVAMLFFYLIPYFGINPKTNLFIFLLVSSALIAWWRTKLFVRLGPRHRQPAIIIGHQEEVTTLVKEINENSRYQLEFVLAIDIDDDFDPARRQAELKRIIDERNIAVIVADVKSRKMAELLPLLYRLSFLESRVVFLDIHRVYEEIFDRLPLSVLREDWILENLSDRRHFVYDLTKRGVDIIAGLIMGLLTLLVLPLVWLLIKIEDGGPVWLRQNRLGQHGRDITVYKFRTMKRSEEGVWLGESDNQITWVGWWLRKTNIDELPQALAIIKGDISLIGPRSDIKDLGRRLAGNIPFYHTRYFIRPGLTGWAQIKQSYNLDNISPQTVAENTVRLTYDLYYLKNRSLFLDLAVTLRTITALLSRLTKGLV